MVRPTPQNSNREDPNLGHLQRHFGVLQASLFTSVVAFGLAAMAVAVGIVLALNGFAIRAPVTT